MHCFLTLLCCTFYLLVKQLKGHRGTTVQKCLLRVAIFFAELCFWLQPSWKQESEQEPRSSSAAVESVQLHCCKTNSSHCQISTFALYESATLAYAATVVAYVALYNCVSMLHSYNKDINPLQGAKLQKVLSCVQAGA